VELLESGLTIGASDFHRDGALPTDNSRGNLRTMSMFSGVRGHFWVTVDIDNDEVKRYDSRFVMVIIDAKLQGSRYLQCSQCSVFVFIQYYAMFFTPSTLIFQHINTVVDTPDSLVFDPRSHQWSPKD
jgi:hypothetical protein